MVVDGLAVKDHGIWRIGCHCCCGIRREGTEHAIDGHVCCGVGGRDGGGGATGALGIVGSHLERDT